MLYLQLIWVFVKAGLLGFGGGMAVISLIQGEVLSRGWMTETEFIDIVGISQVTPGPIGINCATYVGYTVGGVWGSLLASAAIVFPSLVIMLIICRIYDSIRDRYQDNRTFQNSMRIIRILVVLLVAHAAFVLFTPSTFIDWKSWAIFGVVFACMLLPLFKKNKVTKLIGNPILLILAAGAVGWMIYC
ncbi:MAG: chromate transporter [Paludibacteraceae bacterium]|nr:chromate transporter [Paludibacteraceae bacterium]